LTPRWSARTRVPELGACTVHLQQANAVLSCDRAAEREGVVNDVVEGRLGAAACVLVVAGGDEDWV
jgi:hypothetical protein